jgi:hypothetical protein
VKGSNSPTGSNHQKVLNPSTETLLMEESSSQDYRWKGLRSPIAKILSQVGSSLRRSSRQGLILDEWEGSIGSNSFGSHPLFGFKSSTETPLRVELLQDPTDFFGSNSF